MKRNRTLRLLLESALVFLAVAAVTTVAVIVYGAISQKADRSTVVWVMLVVVVMISVIGAMADLAIRKFFVERQVDRILEQTDRIAAGDFRREAGERRSGFSDYDRILDNLDRTAEQLSKSQMLNADFVANVSHEIKTPLAVIRGYASALRTEMDPARRDNYLQTLVSACERLSALVGNVLSLSRLENVKLLPAAERTEVGEMLRTAAISFEDAIEAKHIALECDIEDVAIESIPAYLEIVWNNLLSNAVKFTPEGGKIFIGVKASAGGVSVKIADTGCGISPETGSRIFEKFYQEDTSHAQEGNGLGLALVKKVISLLGGEISVESKLGEGSTFTVDLIPRAGS